MRNIVMAAAIAAVTSASPALGQFTWKPDYLGIVGSSHSSPSRGACSLGDGAVLESNLIRALGELGIDYAHNASKNYQRYVEMDVSIDDSAGGECFSYIRLRIVRFHTEDLDLGSDAQAFLRVEYCRAIGSKKGSVYDTISSEVFAKTLTDCLEKIEIMD